MGLTSKVLNELKKQAASGPGVGWGYKLAACVLDKRGRVLSMRTNSYKTHPIAAKYNGWGHLHAELNATIATGMFDHNGSTLAVIRVHRNGELACSKPCDGCRKFIEDCGFDSVVYVDEEGELIEETIN